MYVPENHRLLASAGKLAVVVATGGLVVVLASFLISEAPKASVPDATGAQVQRLVKSDRLPIFVKGTACSRRGWPHYEQGCLFDRRGSADDVRTVRIVNLERRDLQAGMPVIKVLALR
jgi:hypothetical protein